MRRFSYRAWGLAVALAVGGIVFADVQPGQVRSAQVKAGMTIREAPKPLGKVVQTLAYGTRVTVVAISGYYAQVRTDDGVTGWVRSADLVEPGALTGAGAYGASGAGRVASADVSAAGRQFDEGTEGRYKASSAELSAAYAALDALESKGPKPGSPEVEAFIRDGKLGR